MDVNGLVVAEVIDARHLVYRTPGGEAPKALFDGHAVLKAADYALRADGSFVLTRPPVFDVRAVI